MSSLIPVREPARVVAPPLFPPSASASAAEDASADELSLRDVVVVLRRHLWMIAAISALTFGAAAYVVLTAQPLFQARATIRLVDERRALTGGLQGAAMDGVLGRQYDPLLSQLQVLRSRGVASQVVAELGLQIRSTTPGFSVAHLAGVQVAEDAVGDTLKLDFSAGEYRVRAGAADVRANYGTPVALSGVRFAVAERPAAQRAVLVVGDRDATVDALMRGLRAGPRDKTDVIDVDYTSPQPELAQRVVNATVRIFRQINAQQAQEQSIRRRLFVEGQLAETDSLLASAQLALTRFREREQVFSSQEQMAAEQEGLMGLDVRREELAADRQMYQNLVDRLSRARPGEASRDLRALVSAPGIATNPVVSQLYNQLVRYEMSLDSLTTGAWGSAATNPDVERLRALAVSTRGELVDAVRGHIASVDARLEAMNGLMARSAAQIRTLPSAEAEEMRLRQRVEAMQAAAQQLRQEYQNARIAEAVEAGQVQVVDLAALPRQPIGTGSGLKLGLGLVLGLLLGGGAAFLREHMNTAIRSREDVETALGIAGLGVIPRVLTARTVQSGRRLLPVALGRRDAALPVPANQATELVTIWGTRSAGSEAYRTLRTNLLFTQAGSTLRTLVVTSASPAEGKTTVASNLAVTFAQQGLRVLIVDCDLRRPRLHEVFREEREPGFTEALLGYKQTAEVIRPTQVENLFMLPAGTVPPNPSELVGGERMREMLVTLGREFDLVILDTPPLLAAADAAILGTRVDGTVLVLRAGRTDRRAVQQAVAQITAVGAPVLGAVLNDADGKVAQYGGYYQYGYYGPDK